MKCVVFTAVGQFDCLNKTGGDILAAAKSSQWVTFQTTETRFGAAAVKVTVASDAIAAVVEP